MAEVIRYVDPAATGSGNGTSWTNAYTSLAACETAEDDPLGDLVASGDWLHIYCRSSGAHPADTTNVIFDAAKWTTGAANYVLIEAASTDRADADGWDATKYRLVVTDNNAIGLFDNYLRIDGLQIQIIYSSASGKACIYVASQAAGANDIRISNCRLVGDTDAASNSSGIQTGNVNTVLKAWNNIIYDFDSRGIWMDDSNAADIYNCTVYNCTFRGIDQDSGTVNVYNTAVLDTADDFSGTFNVIDYCASDDNDTTGTNVVESGGGAGWPNDFEGAATGDFRLKSTSNLVGATTDKSSSLFTDDIEGTTRGATWDVGAYEYVGAGGGTTVSCIASDGIALSDSSLRFAKYQVSASDGIGLSDGDTGLMSLLAKATDSIDLNDSSLNLLKLLVSAADSITVNDNSAGLLKLLANASDEIVLNDSTSGLLALLATATDSIILSDISTDIVKYQVVSVDSVTVDDSATVKFKLLVSAADGIIVDDNATVTITIAASALDSIVLEDSASGLLALLASAMDGITLQDISTTVTPSDITGELSVTFSTKKSTITFTVKKPSISFAEKRPKIDFN